MQKELEGFSSKVRKNEANVVDSKHQEKMEKRLSKINSPLTESKLFQRPRTDTMRSTASETGFNRNTALNSVLEKEYQEVYKEVMGVTGGDFARSKDTMKLLNQLIINKKRSQFENQKYNYHIFKKKNSFIFF